MASVIPLHRTAAPLGRLAAPPSAPRRLLGHLLGLVGGVIRRDLARRELLRLDDRQLRDIGLDRRDLLGPGDIHLAAMAGSARTGISPFHLPGA